MTRKEFQDVVSAALEELPPEFQDALHNLDIQVRWAPTPEERRRSRLRAGHDLFGIYLGIPITRRGSHYGMVVPDVIVIYQRSHERATATREQMIEQARQTLLHEIGHYMGIDEDRLRELGVG
ncbi:MAG TPA: metallopeptidase family protein [Dehalococcoidia bacterium]|jgi:predicted Zn-dependent protease with MMP-like domain|nr:metallopeptidase family protein [Dehalococcoidia bacterium]